MLTKAFLEELYQVRRMSIAQMALKLGLSRNVISTALKTYGIPIRSKSEASYIQHGKSFSIKANLNSEEKVLYGLGIGLYWGEGNKVDEYSVRLGNTDPNITVIFVKFLQVICGVNSSDKKFGLQIFNDSNQIEALKFWMNKLQCKRESIHKTISTIPPQGKGTYKNKNKYGVIQVYVSNKRLKTWLMNEISEYAAIAQR